MTVVSNVVLKLGAQFIFAAALGILLGKMRIFSANRPWLFFPLCIGGNMAFSFLMYLLLPLR